MPADKRPSASNKYQEENPYEFCEVCRLNHNQGRRHKYFPSHLRSLSSLLSRYQRKISSLQNPTLSNNDDDSSIPDGFWCVFCALDVRDRSNAIYHLASSEHLRHVKDFLRKHGGGVDRVDLFRVSDADLVKWEKGFKLLKHATSTSSKAAVRPRVVPSEVMRVIEHIIKSFREPQDLALFSIMQVPCLWVCKEVWVFQEGQTASGEGCPMVLQKYTQSSHASDVSQANVHIGALPPWLDASEEYKINQLDRIPYLNKSSVSSAQTSQSRKLNPKRVGAAWAERRKVELEMEKRGERVPDLVDANWLPNFGRVWQAGTRKESRKEFETEKQKLIKDDVQPELSFKIQPYISKRMRTGSPNADSAAGGC